MDRRAIIKLAAGASLLSLPLASRFAKAAGSGRTRYVFIGDQSSATARDFFSAIGTHIAKTDRSWTSTLETLDIYRDAVQVERLLEQYGPNTLKVEWPIIIRIPSLDSPALTDGEIELWNLEWLNDLEDGIVDACYPISGGWWSVEGDWNPTITKVRNHLFHSPNHTEGHFTEEWLNLLNRSELQSIHSDHHREMTNAGRVHWTHVNQECPSN